MIIDRCPSNCETYSRPHVIVISWCCFGILRSVTYVIGSFASISVFCITADQAPLRAGSDVGAERAACKDIST